MARISGGLLRGRTLVVPKQIRATEEKVRQAFFNILGSAIVGATVLDGFAGSGAFGLEALSRGAGRVIFLESHPASIKAIRENLAKIAGEPLEGEWVVHPGDVLRRLGEVAREEGPFDIVVFDPPYEAVEGKKLLNAVNDCAILTASGVLCLEHALRDEPPSRVGPLALVKQHRYGGTVLSFYERTVPEEPQEA